MDVRASVRVNVRAIVYGEQVRYRREDRGSFGVQYSPTRSKHLTPEIRPRGRPCECARERPHAFLDGVVHGENAIDGRRNGERSRIKQSSSSPSSQPRKFVRLDVRMVARGDNATNGLRD